MISFRKLVTLAVVSLGMVTAAGVASPAEEKSDAPIGDAWSDPRNPIVKLFSGERLDLWSLKPIRVIALPEVQASDRVRNPLDRFIISRLESQQHSLSPEADRRTLARRLSYDLTGLPPTFEQVQRLQNDSCPEAIDRFIEELLASPRYGEHVARMWLDVVRYSDSNGFDWDEFRPKAWMFRDYVIRSLNADKPFDRFLLEQLAGDELLDGPPRTLEDQQALIATGYLRMGPQDNAAGLFNEQERSRAELMADLVETTASAFLGLTFSCCRCHDHKTDPLSHADHYRLRAFFEGVKKGDDLPINLADSFAEITALNAKLDEQIQAAEKERGKILDEAKAKLVAANKSKFAKEAPKEGEIIASLSPSDREKKQKLEAVINDLKPKRRTFDHALLMTDDSGKIPATRVLHGGDYRTPAEVVSPGFPSILDPQPATILPVTNSKSSGRRTALARWIASPKNPLTARVMVNRVWQELFGVGLVATSNDFGYSGTLPTHPELLDWLADDFIRSGWSLKALHRRIVTSSTYLQQSTITAPMKESDADNRWYGRQNVKRLTAEQLRDSLLVVSGLLTTKAEGPPIWPELPAEILQANPAFLDDNAEKTKGWYPSPKEQQPARSLFLVQKRTVRVPFLEAFDQPDNAVSCSRRLQSTVAPQALSLLNSSTAIQAAHALAARIESSGTNDLSVHIERLYQTGLQRNPTDFERARCRTFLAQRKFAELTRVLLNLNEFAYRD